MMEVILDIGGWQKVAQYPKNVFNTGRVAVIVPVELLELCGIKDGASIADEGAVAKTIWFTYYGNRNKQILPIFEARSEVPICPANGVPEWCPERNADWITPQLVRKTARIDFGLDKEE